MTAVTMMTMMILVRNPPPEIIINPTPSPTPTPSPPPPTQPKQGGGKEPAEQGPDGDDDGGPGGQVE